VTELSPEIVSAHDAAVAQGSAGYADPATGLFVLTSRFLADRGWCCGNGCRHCPYTGDAKRSVGTPGV
jgi:Family of unknown function (DUF5522)